METATVARTLLVYGRRAYASELDLFRNARVTATHAQSLFVVGRTPAMVFRVRHAGGEALLPDLEDVYRVTSIHPEAAVELIPVHGQRSRRH
jgi:hypothetical protein